MRAHRASHTALKVSRILLLVADDPQRAPLLPAGAAAATESLLRATGMLKDWHLRAYRSPGFRKMLAWSERRMIPGQSTHMVLRKRVIEDEVRDALRAGATQVLVVGAGFDTLAMRLGAEYPAVRFVEIDHPGTQSLKRHALQQLESPPNLVLHPVDLAQTSLPEALEELGGWRRSDRSVIIAEGVLMYLAQSDVADFLRGVASVAGAGSRLIATYLLPDDKGRPQLGPMGGLTRASLKAIGEPLQWASTPEVLASMLGEAGFLALEDPGRIDLRARYLVPAGLDALPLGTVERVALADRQ